MQYMYLLIVAGLAASHPAHEHHAPHQGTLVELGDEAAHLELVLDSRRGELTGYVLDGEAEQPVRVVHPAIGLRLRRGRTEHELRLAAVANPLTGEAVGDTSQFHVSSNVLKGTEAFDGVLPRLVVRGVAFENVPFRLPAVAR